jgi:2-polyprenyl-6-methoxyphenol hydroxylase-like FAD-dependent oxidoreductase
MTGKPVPISGAGIAGLTPGILLKEKGWEPTIVERDAATRTDGYIIDFAGTGWDVAERMGLVEELRKVTYPIDAFAYVDENGDPYLALSIARVRSALSGNTPVCVAPTSNAFCLKGRELSVSRSVSGRRFKRWRTTACG